MRNALYENIQIDEMIINELSNGYHPAAVREAIEQTKELLIEHKREYRKDLKLKSDNHYETYKNGFVVNGGGEWDYFWRKVFFPGEQWTKEEMEEFKQENWKRCRYSAYDCTGDLFTRAIDCFNVPSGVVCYIREALDV